MCNNEPNHLSAKHQGSRSLRPGFFFYLRKLLGVDLLVSIFVKKLIRSKFFDEINNDYTIFLCSLFIIRELLDLDLIIRKLIFTSAAFGENCFNFVICKKIKMILRCTEFFWSEVCKCALRSDKKFETSKKAQLNAK